MKKILSNILLPFSIAIFNIVLIFYPSEILGSARNAISLWLNNVFPTLFPFLVGTNILMKLGFVNFLGTILEPIMYPLFGIPGIGGFALVCGMTSGYPMGAKITSELREQNLITKNEAQKLISFSNNCGPLFIIGTVGVSMFKNPTVGYFILICHYIGSILTGIIINKFDKKKKSRIHRKDILRRAYRSMIIAKKNNNNGISAVFSESVKNSMETILLVGGYIILFSVILEIMEITRLIIYIGNFISYFTILDKNIIKGISYGIFEITNGANFLSNGGVSLPNLLSAIFVISFGGFCIHMQSLSFISKTDINVFKYVFAKMTGGVISVIIGFLAYPFFNFNVQSVNVFKNFEEGFFSRLFFSSYCFILTIVIFFAIYFILKTLNLFFFRFSRKS